MKSTFIDATPEAGKAFYQRHLTGPVVMLNLLRFRAVADYSQNPELAPAKTISGEEAYLLYMEHATPLLEKAGSKVVFSGKGGGFLIGPADEQWDAMLLVRHQSAEQFIAFANDREYLKIAGHRAAALQDSRLLPLEEGLSK